MYTPITDSDGSIIAIKRSDGLTVPLDERNMDYQAFMKWNIEQAVSIDVQTKIAPSAVEVLTRIADRLRSLWRETDYLVGQDTFLTVAILNDAKIWRAALVQLLQDIIDRKIIDPKAVVIPAPPESIRSLLRLRGLKDN